MSTDELERRPMAKSLLFVLLATVGCGLWIFHLNGTDGGRAWRSLLVNFLFFSSLSGGMVVWPALVSSCHGRWHRRLERIAAAGIVFSIPSLMALVVLWIGSPRWAPWYRAHLHQEGIRLDNAFLFGRDLVALLVFWGVAAYYLLERRRNEGRVLGTVLILVYCLAFSLIGFDLVVALAPKWRIDLAAGYFLVSGFYLAIICWALLSAWQSEAEPDQLHDMGKLIVVFSLMTSYLMYVHLSPTWARELPFGSGPPLPMHEGLGRIASSLIICTVCFGPVVLFFAKKSRKNRWTFAGISFVILAGIWIEGWWLVAPIARHLARPGLSELSVAIAFIGMLGLGMEHFHRYLYPAKR